MILPATTSLARPNVDGFIYCEDFELQGRADVQETAFIDNVFIDLE
jgi:hypothetical protein